MCAVFSEAIAVTVALKPEPVTLKRHRKKTKREYSQPTTANYKVTVKLGHNQTTKLTISVSVIARRNVSNLL